MQFPLENCPPNCILISARCAAICLFEKHVMRSGTDEAPIETRLLLSLLHKQAELVCGLILDPCLCVVSCPGHVYPLTVLLFLAYKFASVASLRPCARQQRSRMLLREKKKMPRSSCCCDILAKGYVFVIWTGDSFEPFEEARPM